MTIAKLERVLWRLRRTKGTKDTDLHTKYLNSDLRRAVMYECGTHPVTYTRTRKALMTLGWIESWGNHRIILTDEDLRGG